MDISTIRRRLAPAAGVASLALIVAACGGNASGGDSTGSGATTDGEKLSGSVVIDGSSTVAPLTTVAAELFIAENPGVNVTVGTSGSGGGFEKFCAGETDISDASRQIKDEEAATCESNDIKFDILSIANDAITVVVNKENDWAKDLTVEQLNKIWAPDSKVKSWNEVDPSLPNEPLTLFGPGTDSGTFDYFTDEVNGEEGASRTDFQASEDDNVLVAGVAGAKGAMGYFGFSYYEENADKLNAVNINGVAPSADAVQDGTYSPLGRQLYIYPSAAALEKPQVKAFVEFYIENIDQIVKEAGFIALNDDQKKELQDKFDQLLQG